MKNEQNTKVETGLKPVSTPPPKPSVRCITESIRGGNLITFAMILTTVVIAVLCVFGFRCSKYIQEITTIKNEQETLKARVDHLEKTMKYFSME